MELGAYGSHGSTRHLSSCAAIRFANFQARVFSIIFALVIGSFLLDRLSGSDSELDHIQIFVDQFVLLMHFPVPRTFPALSNINYGRFGLKIWLNFRLRHTFLSYLSLSTHHIDVRTFALITRFCMKTRHPDCALANGELDIG